MLLSQSRLQGDGVVFLHQGAKGPWGRRQEREGLGARRFGYCLTTKVWERRAWFGSPHPGGRAAAWFIISLLRLRPLAPAPLPLPYNDRAVRVDAPLADAGAGAALP